MPPTDEASAAAALPLYCVTEPDFSAWLDGQAAVIRGWLSANGFQPERGRWSLLPDGKGAATGVVVGLGKHAPTDAASWFWLAAGLADRLPPGSYRVADTHPPPALPFT